MPTTLSRLSSMTGTREKPLRRNSDIVVQVVVFDEHHVVARHHHLADARVTQLEDGVDHPALAGLDHRRRLGEVDQSPELGLGGDRSFPQSLPGVSVLPSRIRSRGTGPSTDR